MPLRALAAVIALAGLPGSGQILSIGLKAGVPLTGAYSTGQTATAYVDSYNRPYIIGPTAEIHLPFRLSFEVDALYRRDGFTIHSGGFDIPPVSTRTDVNEWQIPFLGKYEVGHWPIRPFVDIGVTLRHISANGREAFEPDNPNGAGFTVGGGAALKLFVIRVSPEFRYTRWFNPPYSASNVPLRSTENQADFLLGVTF